MSLYADLKIIKYTKKIDNKISNSEKYSIFATL